jgi:hypothetical protein
MIRRALVGLLLAFAGGVPAVSAHEVRPAYLEIREVDAGLYDVFWKVPARGEYRLSVYVRLPPPCEGQPSAGTFAGESFVERWQARCPGGLVGQSIEIEGLAATRTDVLAQIRRADGTVQTARLTPDRARLDVVAAPGSLEVARTYFLLGVEHILGGIDHLLFVLILLFLVGGGGRLVAAITAFTVAHSITLALATLGLLNVPSAPVEATIALSVMFVAAEVLQRARGRAGLAARSPWLVAFAFGLLHGLGFAGALQDTGLPETDVPLALLLFNLGVEAGQLLFIVAVFVVFGGVARLLDRGRGTPGAPWHARDAVRTPVAYGVGSIAAFWVVQRVVAFWS